MSEEPSSLAHILPNTHIVSNHMVFDQDVLVGFSSPSYHVFNKKALYAKDTSPYFQLPDLAQRGYLLLLGDSLGDTTMCEGMDVTDQNKIKIGFLNDKVERLPDYLQAYDVVLLGDPDFEFISTLLEDIAAEKPPPPSAWRQWCQVVGMVAGGVWSWLRTPWPYGGPRV